MSVLDYIDSDILTPVYQNKLPLVRSRNVDAISKELYYAIKAKEPIFIYGDYDMDGFCCVKVWEEFLQSVYDVPPLHFSYINRQHQVDRNIVEQARKAGARVVIICDSGSGKEDHDTVAMLRANGHTPIIIDHHNWVGDYRRDSEDVLVYNSHEERELLGGNEISGAYSCLLVANYLCERYLSHSLSYSAMVYALASMYSDVVDMSTPAGRALYNTVSVIKMPLPSFFSTLNSFGYTVSKRFFSFIVAPKINACFRTENFGPLNQALDTLDKYNIKSVVTRLCEAHDEASKLTSVFTPRFKREKHGCISLCLHEADDETRMLHVRNFSGLIANRIADEEKGIALALIKDGHWYEGSYRDFYNRQLLNTFQLFCTADGHDSAFGLKVSNLSEFRRHVSKLAGVVEQTARKDYEVISSSLVRSQDDIQVLALYNEYCNVRPRVLLTHRCPRARMLRSTKYRKFYDVGLPYEVCSTLPIVEGSVILIDPTITRSVELRCVD